MKYGVRSEGLFRSIANGAFATRARERRWTQTLNQPIDSHRAVAIILTRIGDAR